MSRLHKSSIGYSHVLSPVRLFHVQSGFYLEATHFVARLWDGAIFSTETVSLLPATLLQQSAI
jgi:hypothetical protein